MSPNYVGRFLEHTTCVVVGYFKTKIVFRFHFRKFIRLLFFQSFFRLHLNLRVNQNNPGTETEVSSLEKFILVSFFRKDQQVVNDERVYEI